MAAGLRAGLARLPGVAVCDLGEVKCGIVSFTVAGKPALEVKRALAAKGIHVTVSDVASTRLDMQARHLPEVVRASVHYYNSEEEVQRFCREIASLR